MGEAHERMKRVFIVFVAFNMSLCDENLLTIFDDVIPNHQLSG